MEQRHNAALAGLNDILIEIPLPPGVLTMASVAIDSNALQYGDCFASLAIFRPTVGYDRPLAVLASGLITRWQGLLWQGTISIQPGYRLAMQYIGQGPCTVTTTFERLTTTNIKEQGEYSRAVSR